MSGTDGAVLYAHYLSLYDQALRKRLENLELLMSDVYARLPGCESAVTLGDVPGRPKLAGENAERVIARYAGPNVGGPGYVIVMNTGRRRAAIRILFDQKLHVTGVTELRFDMQGNAGVPVRGVVTQSATASGSGTRLSVDGFAVRILRLSQD
jgi:hypothetical protein